MPEKRTVVGAAGQRDREREERRPPGRRVDREAVQDDDLDDSGDVGVGQTDDDGLQDQQALDDRRDEQRIRPPPGEEAGSGDRDGDMERERTRPAGVLEGVGQPELDHAEDGQRCRERDVHGRWTAPSDAHARQSRNPPGRTSPPKVGWGRCSTGTFAGRPATRVVLASPS
jgi:hypothetical protein